jgi:hypothetical protein
MRIKYFSMLMTIVLLLFSIQVLFASGRKIGTAGAPELLIPMGVRSVGMSGANIATVSNSEAIYWNPAGLSKISNSEVNFSYMSYFADMTISYASAGFTIDGVGTIGLSLQSLDIGEIDVTTIQSPEGTGQILKPDYLTLTASYAKALTDRISFGVNTKLISEQIGDMSASAVGFDLGLQYRSNYGIDFGISLKNIGTKIEFGGTPIEFNSDIPNANPNATTRKTSLDMAEHELPTSMNIGLAYTTDVGKGQKLNIAGQYSNNSFLQNDLITGFEYSYLEFIFLRAGYILPLFDSDDFDQDYIDSYQYDFTVGAGLDLEIGGSKVLINYAYRNMKTFDAQNYFSVGFRF